MKTGKVYLVGAGPGDPGLMTVRGLQLLRRAQVIVYDQLVNPVLLEEVSDNAERIFVGKQAGRHCIAQSEINEVLINYAQARLRSRAAQGRRSVCLRPRRRRGGGFGRRRNSV